MNWDDLKVFLEMSRHGRLADSAERLNMDQTTISRRLQRLEQAIGAQLFTRTRAGHELTTQGRQLMTFAEQCEASVIAAQENLLDVDKAMSGSVRLNTTEGFGSHFIARGLPKFSMEHPNIEIDLIASAGFMSLSKREIDLAIQLARPERGRLVAQKLTDYRLKLYASQAYLKDREPISSLADLKNHRLIGYVDDLIYAPELRYLDVMLRSATPKMRSSSIVAQHNMTVEGGGLCVLPCFIAHNDQRLQPVLESEIEVTRTFWLMVHEDMRHLARIKVVRDFLFDYVAQHQDLLFGET